MANVTITQLPQAGPIQGTESVPIVQNGVTVQTTTAAIAASPAQFQTFLTVNQEPTLPNSRALATGTGLGLVDNGALSTLQLTLNAASGSLESASNGIIAKTNSNTVAARTLQTTGAGLSVTDGNGVSGNPTFQLTGLAAAIANAGGTGMLAVVGGTTIAGRDILGTADEITVTNGNGSGNPTIAIASNPVLPGNGAVTLPVGTTGQRPGGTMGQVRYNSTNAAFEGYSAGQWREFSLTGGVTLINTGTGLTGGPITSTGTISIDSTVATLTGSQTLTNKTISGASNTLSNIGNSSLTNSSVTINGTTVSLGASATITSSTTNSLTFDNSGSGAASGTAFNGSTAYTISYNTIGASPLAGSTSITTLGTVTTGTWNATPIANNYLANSAVTIGTTSISLGGSSLTLGGLTSVTVTQNPSAALDLATKQYVDTLVSSGITYHTPVKYEVPDTTGNLNATYSNGTAGVGATLTNAGTLAAFAPDGPTAQVGDRILIYNQTNQFENGVYTVTVVGDGSTAWVLTRSSDTNTYALKSPNGLGEGDAFFVTSGNTGAGETYVCNTVGTITFGTTAITFVQVSASQVYSAGTGLTLTGTQFSISNTGVSANTYGSASAVPVFAVNAQGQLTSVTNTSIAISGSQITSGTVGSSYISGSYTGITGVGTLTAGTWNASTIGVGYGGTGLASYTTGDILYASGTTTISKLGIGTNGQILTSSGTAPQWTSGSSISVGTATNLAGGTAGALPYQTGAGATTFLALGTTNYVLTAGASAPQYVAQSTLSVGSATNATNTTNVAITANSTNATNYLTFVSATTGNLPQLVNSSITCNPSTGKITGGVAGGAF